MHLHLKNTGVTDAGLEHFGGLTNLIFLNLIGMKVTETGVTKLHKALPNCKIEWNGGVIEPAK